MKREKLVLTICLLVLGYIVPVVAQTATSNDPSMMPLPIDPKVRYGKLDNGLTYYIRHNELPKERAEFFIAQRVGSILEEDNQRGLAHFLEHMAFNGTKNFPGNQMTNYLETIGVKSGENLNAYTGFDETVYNISNAPVTREGIIDSCLLVLHDWSGFITLSEEEIEKERGVIREEMRTRSNARFRTLESLLPQIMPESRYAKRLPIGTEKVVMNFTKQELVDYYHKWYRPDLQGIIIVGDIDVDQVEAKIKTLFADIPKPVDPAERIYFPVPDNIEPMAGISTDKEATSTQLMTFFKNDAMPKEKKASIQGLIFDYFTQIGSEIMNERFNAIIEKPNPPFVYAMGQYDQFYVARTKDAWLTFGVAQEGDIKRTLNAIAQETERVKRFGFTPSEYERARTNVLKRYEDAYNERDKEKNSAYVDQYVSHFTTGGYIPGIEMEYNLINQIAPNIPLENVNQQIQRLIGNTNIVIALTGPEKEGLVYPSKEELTGWFKEAQNAELTALEDDTITEPLITELPKPGRVESVTQDEKFGTTNYTLSNGVKVVIKTTNFKDNDIQMEATSPGGTSLFPITEAANIKVYPNVVDLGGLGNFSNVDLRKMLAGKTVSISPTINVTVEGFKGNSSVKDLETMFQLIYLYFTAIREDNDAFLSYMERLGSQLKSQEAEPTIALIDTLHRVLYGENPLTARLKSSDLEKVNYQTIMDWYRDRYKDAGDFTFVFVGNIDAEKAKPMIEQYLGALPSINRKETSLPVDLYFKKGNYKNIFEKTVQNPKATVVNLYPGNVNYNLKNNIELSMLSQILNILYMEKVREDESGTYGVGVSGNISEYPKGQTLLQMSFDTNEEKMLRLNDIVIKEFKNIAEQGPRAEDFAKVKEFMLKKQKENEQENNYWRSILLQYYRNGYDGYTDYVKTLNAVTSDDIKAFTKELIDQQNEKIVIMNGVKSK
ncbi:MAG: insulinase family protein [Candidatus Azobacteroides sp.]|nr:insulinase family protein [Candidatus Azobacteroides sp.]